MAKCSECGFLAARNLYTRQLEEVEKEYRDNGASPTKPFPDGVEMMSINGIRNVYGLPVCFARAFPLDLEIVASASSKDNGILTVINRERQCPYFVKWQQGFTPKEHQEMLDRQRKLEQEDKRRTSDRIWHWVELVLTLAIGAMIAFLAKS
jgi:hypothetical protein